MTDAANNDIVVRCTGLYKRYGKVEAAQAPRPRGAARRRLRSARPERRRQDHDLRHPVRLAARHLGHASVLGVDSHRLFSLRGRVAVLPQDASFPPQIPVRDQLTHFGRLMGLPTQKARAESDRAADRGRPRRRRQHARPRAQPRHAQARRPGAGVGRQPGGHLPRRADRRPRSQERPRHQGPRGEARRERHGDPVEPQPGGRAGDLHPRRHPRQRPPGPRRHHRRPDPARRRDHRGGEDRRLGAAGEAARGLWRRQRRAARGDAPQGAVRPGAGCVGGDRRGGAAAVRSRHADPGDPARDVVGDGVPRGHRQGRGDGGGEGGVGFFWGAFGGLGAYWDVLGSWDPLAPCFRSSRPAALRCGGGRASTWAWAPRSAPLVGPVPRGRSLVAGAQSRATADDALRHPPGLGRSHGGKSTHEALTYYAARTAVVRIGLERGFAAR